MCFEREICPNSNKTTKEKKHYNFFFNTIDLILIFKIIFIGPFCIQFLTYCYNLLQVKI